MRKAVSFLCLFAVLLALLAGCGADSTTPTTTSSTTTTTTVTTGTTTAATNVSENDMFSNRDSRITYDKDEAVTIQLNGNSAKADSDSVSISGSTVTITEEGTYVVSGELNNGRLVVNANDAAKLQIVLNGATITSKTSAALYIAQADKVFLTLADQTENTLENGGSFIAIDGTNIDAALFSKQDLTLNGNGTLTVISPAGHGIVCKDDLVFTGGAYVINSSSHGLDVNDSVRIKNASLTIDAGKDAIHSENNNNTEKGFVYMESGSIKAEAEGDGITAGTYMQIEGGTIDLTVGGGSQNGEKEHSDFFGGFMGGGGKYPRSQTNTTEDSASMKGLKAQTGLLINGGNITINSADDAVHSDSSLTINGGTFTIATGDDAFHAEEDLTITGGTVNISESYEGLEALHITVKGGAVTMVASDDGINAAGGTDNSGFGGGRDGMFGGRRPGGGGFGGMSSNSKGSITITGGTLYVNSSGDAIDANGTLEISGGHITLVGPTQGDTAVLDYDKTATITGGTFIGTGSTMMAQSFTDSTQGVIFVNAGSQAAGTTVVLKDTKGNTILTREPELNFAMVILSSPELKKGSKYALTIGSKTVTVTAE